MTAACVRAGPKGLAREVWRSARNIKTGAGIVEDCDTLLAIVYQTHRLCSIHKVAQQRLDLVDVIV
jgi:hypothetical protein